MRVLLVTRAGIGGAARHVLDVVRGLAGRHEITVLASPLEDPRYPGRLAAAGARVRELPVARGADPVADWRAFRLVRGELARADYDLIHAHVAKPGAIARLAAGRTPLVYSPHGFYHLYPDAPRLARRAAFRAERLLGSAATVLALTAEWERACAERDRIRPRAATVVVRNGVPLPPPPPPEDRAEFRRRLGVRAGETLVAAVGRLAAPKDPLTLLRAAGRAGPAIRLVLVGDGPLRSACRRIAPANAILAGARDDVPRILAAADVFALATGFEACSYSLLEAMAAGLPSVATDVPGTRESLGDAGILVPPGDDDALAGALAGLAADPGRAEAAGARLRVRAAERYSVAAMLRATEDAWARAAAATG